MTMDDQITLGELARGMAALESRLDKQFTLLNRRLDNLQFVSREVHDVKVKQMEDRLDDLEDTNRWFSRGLVGSFLFPVLVAIVVAMVVAR